MFTRPEELTDADVAEAVAAGWGVRADEIGYAAVGFGSHHWRITAMGTHRFATVDDLTAKRWSADEPLDRPRSRLIAALTTARALSDAGLAFVVAPLPSRDGEIVRPIGERYAVAVYPFVEGTTHAWGPYPTDAERDAVVDLLTVLHRAPASASSSALPDDLVIASRDALTAALGDTRTPWGPGPFAEPARHLLGRHATAVRAALARYDALAAGVAARRQRWVLTHGEPHRGNTIVTAVGTLLIDWDTTLFAPPERDLWSLVDADPTVAERYAAATGVTPDGDALELYALRWELTDISIYVGEFRRPHRDTQDAGAAWAGLQAALEPPARG